MNNQRQANSRHLQIQGLLEKHLQKSSLSRDVAADVSHLDEDTLTAFVEGNLLEGESKPIISHLAKCSYCRHISSELVKLDIAFADEPHPAARTEGEPTKVSEVLNGILSRIFGANDGAVFAHEEKEDEGEETKEE